MPIEKMWVEWEDGSDLSQSRKKPGDLSPLTREDDTHRLGQVTLRHIDEDEADSLTDSSPVYIYVTDEDASDARAEEEGSLLVALVFIGAIVALGIAKPHVKIFWNDKALPKIKSTWIKVARIREVDSRVATEVISAK